MPPADIGDETRLRFARETGADVALDYRQQDVVREVKRLAGGGADVAIEPWARSRRSRTRSAACDREGRFRA